MGLGWERTGRKEHAVVEGGLCRTGGTLSSWRRAAGGGGTSEDLDHQLPASWTGKGGGNRWLLASRQGLGRVVLARCLRRFTGWNA